MKNPSDKLISSNSQEVVEGSIFVAIKGLRFDGHDFIEQAIKNGAKTIIIEDKSRIIPKYKDKVNFVLVANSRIAIATLASEIYKQPKNLVAVTGTNGKTSTANFFMQIIAMLNHHAASIGTMGVYDDRKIFNNRTEYKNLTTPEVVMLHHILEELEKNKINYTAIEASSHGLAQHRLDGIKIKGAAFTSFSQDHLDYHKTMKEYFSAKTLLFSRVLPKGANAILNADIKEFEEIYKICRELGHKVLSYGRKGDFLKIEDISYQNGLNCTFSSGGKKFYFKTSLLGRFQIYNLLAAVGLVYSCGFKMDEIADVLSRVVSIQGRMERVGVSEVFVDYAHTPDALEKALIEMKHGLDGRLIVVFGCGGDRDAIKRPLMGAIATKHSDIVIVTDDNPRTEDPKKIRSDVAKGCDDVMEVGDRQKAIKYAIEHMEMGDRVLIAGKGHENYQIIGKEKLPFDDSKVAAKYI